jgi:hypothetical protein
MRTIAQIDAELARLKAERKALKPVVSLSPGFKRSRSFRPEGEGQRQPRERDNGFLAYLRRQPCEARSLGGCQGASDAAHIRFNDGPDRQNPGGARKNHDRHANPLCRVHHDQQHRGSERAFWDCVGKDAYATAATHFANYEKGADNAQD